MNNHVKRAPYFFRLIKRAFFGCLGLLLGLAFFIPAPLLEPADIARVPNPSKSAWFLLWTQELVSYSGSLIYLILGVGIFFALLPWLPGSPEASQAKWLPQEQRWISTISLLALFAILVLTVVAVYFRGPNWQFMPVF